MKTDDIRFTVKDILKAEVAPALGCTEPVAIALCAAAAAALVDREQIERLEITVSSNIYKNGVAVSIPGTAGLSGLDLAGALGVYGGDPRLRLEVLKDISAQTVVRAKDLIRGKGVEVDIDREKSGLFVQTVVHSAGNRAVCVIEDLHDNITSLKLNDAEVGSRVLLQDAEDPSHRPDSRGMEAWLKKLPLSSLIELLDELDDADLAFLEEGVNTNVRLAEYGLKFGSGLGIGKAMDRLVRQGLMKKDMVLAARMLTSAASDARMAGVNLPAMSSAGSGNHGLTAILPIWAVKQYIVCEHRTVLEAIGLSHIITAYVKAHTGRLSAVCGCSIAAGAGAAAGVAYMLGGDMTHISAAIINIIEDLAGVICDGAKAGCSLKLATAAGTAVQSALLALQGIRVCSSDGIVGISPEQTMQNVGTLSTQGMIETDRTVLRIMLEKQFQNV